MKKIIVLISVFFFMTLNAGFDAIIYSQDEMPGTEEQVVEKIEAEEVAKELADRAEGSYVKGEAAPDLQAGEVALPIIDEESGEVLGYVVAEKEKLVSVLNEAGLTEVANALAAMEAGQAAAETIAAGISSGTITWIAVGIAVLGGIGVAAGGGGGGGGSTSNH